MAAGGELDSSSMIRPIQVAGPVPNGERSPDTCAFSVRSFKTISPGLLSWVGHLHVRLRRSQIS